MFIVYCLLYVETGSAAYGRELGGNDVTGIADAGLGWALPPNMMRNEYPLTRIENLWEGRVTVW